MKVNKEISIIHMKNCIRPTFYWASKRLSRKFFFLKQEIIKELRKIQFKIFGETFII